MPSIEENITAIAANTGRMADALEAIAKLAANPITTSVTTVVAEGTKEAAQVVAGATKAAQGSPKPKTTAPTPKPEPAAPAPAAPAPEKDPLDDDAPAKVYTLEDVRGALKAYRDTHGSAAMLDVLKENGAESLGALKAENYAAVMARVEAA